MNRYFNINGVCDPAKHYMVDLSDRLHQVKSLVDRGDYFVINRARQYGKTTTLSQLTHSLSEDYTVFFISFEGC